jgi:hypothetical protein
MRGIVEQLGSKPVKTKYGMKPTYSFKVGGQWYKTGFKDPKLSVGQDIEFESTTTMYGLEVGAEAIVVHGTTATPLVPTAVAKTDGSVKVNMSPQSYSPKGVFPIPALDGQRAIVRQNALTNARELVQQTIKVGGTFDAGPTVDTIIDIARRFEAYTTGDADVEQVKAAMADAAGVKAA